MEVWRLAKLQKIKILRNKYLGEKRTGPRIECKRLPKFRVKQARENYPERILE